jgi:hypothetical protein
MATVPLRLVGQTDEAVEEFSDLEARVMFFRLTARVGRKPKSNPPVK